MATFSNTKSSNIGTTEVTLINSLSPTVITGINIVNKLGSSASISLYIVRSATTYYILKSKTFEGNQNIEVISGSKMVLEDGDSLRAISTVNESFDIIVSALEGV